jgi:hypothetical protein
MKYVYFSASLESIISDTPLPLHPQKKTSWQSVKIVSEIFLRPLPLPLLCHKPFPLFYILASFEFTPHNLVFKYHSSTLQTREYFRKCGSSLPIYLAATDTYRFKPLIGLLPIASSTVAWDSSFGMATRYGLDGPAIEPRWGRDFPHPSRTVMWPTHPPIKWVPVLFSSVKRPGSGDDYPPSSSAEVKERVDLHFYSPSESSWPVLGWTLHLPFAFQHFVFTCKCFRSSDGLLAMDQINLLKEATHVNAHNFFPASSSIPQFAGPNVWLF